MYLDGNGSSFWRKLNGGGTIENPHIPVVNVESSVGTQIVNLTGVGNTLAASLNIDCRIFNNGYINILNTGNTTFQSFDLLIAPDNTTWDKVANTDYFFTTGTGENEGIATKLIQRVGVNPRNLTSSASTWLMLNLTFVPYLRIVTQCTSARLIYTFM